MTVSKVKNKSRRSTGELAELFLVKTTQKYQYTFFYCCATPNGE
ncbi:MAG: hypothetical protein ACJAYJ_001983 [Saprospiraceae bacterium]|jgi:hypothetical protein